MSRHDWYRNTSWNPAIEQEFFSRLSRCRSSKAQFVRVQAYCLAETGKSDLVLKALELADLMIAKWPEATELAPAHCVRAFCYVHRRKDDLALDAYRQALAQQRAFPNVLTTAHLDFGWLVILRARTDLYAEALTVLDEFGGRELFPAGRYTLFAVRAIIAARAGEIGEARNYARLAIAETNRNSSGLRYHRLLGLVRKPDDRILRQLYKIADLR